MGQHKLTKGHFRCTTLHIPDVGRGVGLSIVMQTPSGRTYLFDTGSGYPEEDGWVGDMNAGRDIIYPFLKSQGISKLDGVITSHAHYDHFGGLLWLKDHIQIDVLIDTNYAFNDTCDSEYAQELGDYNSIRNEFIKKNCHRAIHGGESIDLDLELTVDVLAPPQDFFVKVSSEGRAEHNPPAHYLLNTNSIILRIKHGEIVFLLPGDIEAQDQSSLLIPSLEKESLRCDVLIAPGHGIEVHPDFAQATRPSITIASLFSEWIAHSNVESIMKEVGSDVYITGRDGHIDVVSDGKTYAVEKHEKEPV